VRAHLLAHEARQTFRALAKIHRPSRHQHTDRSRRSDHRPPQGADHRHRHPRTHKLDLDRAVRRCLVLAAYRTRSSQDSGSRQDVHPIERLIIPLDAPIEGVRVTSKGVAGPQAAEFRMAEQHNGLGEVAVASPCRPRSPLIGQEKVRTHRGHSAAHPVCGMIPEIIGVRDWRL
jgi:hypothetical protein